MTSEEISTAGGLAAQTLAPALEKMHREINELLGDLYERVSTLEANTHGHQP